MTALRIAQIQITVSRLDRAEAFYSALGFTRTGVGDDPALAALLGVRRVRQVIMRRGGQDLALQALEPPGAPYPDGTGACDQLFQHFALPADAVIPPDAVPISTGPQHLPQRSGGATCYKFRDPDGHPLELIRFPDGHRGGIDHSAIVSADAGRSIAFYTSLGFRLGARQTNAGPEQDALDGLAHAVVDVVALHPAQATPHLELLAYRSPPVRPAVWGLADIAATRLVIDTGLPGPPALLRDPDGHVLIVRYTAGPRAEAPK